MVAVAHEFFLLASGSASSSSSDLPALFRFTGVFHPAVAHFPIALLMVAALVESWSVIRRQHKPLPTTLVCLYIGTIAAVVAAVLGLANAAASGDKGATLDLHKWLGLGVATVALVVVALSALLVRRGSVRGRTRWAYRGGLFITAGLVGLVGSYGGKLVHGETYYADAYATLQHELARNDHHAEPAPVAVAAVVTHAPAAPTTAPTTAPAVVVAPTPAPALPVAILPSHPAAAPDLAAPQLAAASPPNLGGGQIDYARDIEPIFLANCVKCHNDAKKKGGYRLDAREHVFAAGQSGKVAVMPGRSDESLLIKLVEGKGEYADSIMPPKGDPLTFQQIQLIRRWIDEGAQASAP